MYGTATFLFFMFFRSFIKFPSAVFRRGFSLTEMMVVIFIIILLTTTVAFKYPSLYRNYLLSGTAQDVILAIREAQQYSVNVKASGSGERYGVYFASTTRKMILFLDHPTGGTQRAYEGADQKVREVDLDPSLYFRFTFTPVNGSAIVTDTMSIIFDRPNLAPLVRNQNGGPIGTLYPSIDAPFQIRITGPEKSATVDISPAGPIGIL